MEDIVDIIVTETTNLIEITSQPTDEIIDVNIIDNREDVTLNVTPTLVEININSLTGNFGILWGEIEGTLSNQTDLQNALNLKADLVDGKVPSSQLPSYVDDVVEVANYAALPVTGEVGKIYITLDTNYIYRWTGSVYVEIKDSSAVWGAITGTLSNQTDLQNALNLKANDNAVVHLAGAETITGAKTFSSAVTAPNFILSGGTGNTGLYYGHTDRVVLANYTAGGIDFEVNGGSIVATLFPSGNYGLGITLDAGYKLDVNGTTRISGALSGTSASFSSSITASSIIKSGGTSSQFLKADGSVDSSTYATTSQLHNPVTIGTANGLSLSTQVLSLGLASSSTNGALSSTDWTTFNNKQAALSGTGFVKISGTTISYDNSTYLTTSSAASTYVPYTGANSAVNLGAYDLTVNGIKIGRGAGSISDNTVVGASALTSNTTGSSNTAIGFSALGANTIAGGNTAIGTYALSANISGGTNIAIGYSAGSSITTGSNNVIIGGYAGTSAMSGNVILSDGGGNIRFQWDGTNIKLNGNTVGSNAYTSTAYLPLSGGTLTGALSGTSATFKGIGIFDNSASGDANSGIRIVAPIGTTHYNWMIGAQQNVNTGFEITPSTTVGGTTFSTPALTILQTGAATFSSSVTATNFIASNGNNNTILNSTTATTGWSQLAINNTSGSMVLGVEGSVAGTTTTGSTAYATILRNYTATDLQLATNNTVRATITSSGNVGIGTTSPGQKLSVAGKISFAAYETDQDEFGFWTTTGSTGGVTMSTAGATNLLFRANNTERMRITSSGNVAIGTTSPTAFSGYTTLTIDNTSGSFTEYRQGGTNTFRVGSNESNGGFLYTQGSTPIRFGTIDTERMRITSGGNVLVGTTSDLGARLQVSGDIAAVGTNPGLLSRANSNATTYGFYNNGNGELILTNSGVANVGRFNMSSGAYTALSDANKKKDFEVSNYGLGEVMQLNPTLFRYKTDSSDAKKDLGFIAQEVKDIIPQAYVESNGFIGLNDRPILAAAIKAIQELKAELDTLKNK